MQVWRRPSNNSSDTSDSLKTNSSQGNRVVIVDDYQTFLSNWPFFLEGIQAVRDDSPENMPGVTNDEFFRALVRVACTNDGGVILLLTSRNGKPLGFLVLIDITYHNQPKTVNCYIAYTNRKCPSTIYELKFEAEKWARFNQYKKLQAISYRLKPTPGLSGAIRRYFNKTLGLREKCVVFEATL